MPRVINLLYAEPGMDKDAVEALHLATRVAERFKEKEEVTVNCQMAGSPLQEDVTTFPTFLVFQYSGEILKMGPFMSRLNYPLIYHGMVNIREFCGAQGESLNDDDEEERFWWGKRFILASGTNVLN